MSGPRLSIIPARAATDPALKPRDLQVLCVLGRHTDDLGWCCRSQVKMAEEMRCGRATVFDAIERLVAAGYLERHVQETVSGRDTAHLYRVILDPRHPDLATVREADQAAVPAIPPAGIPAPPAGPEPAPPAGPGPAPINDPSLTTLAEREKERARDEEKNRGEDARALGRAFELAFRDWPTSITDSRASAWRAWLRLSMAERETAASEIGRYVAAAKAVGRTKYCAFGVYLDEKRWEGLAPRAPERRSADDSIAAPAFGPVWGGIRTRALLVDPAETGPATVTREMRQAAHAQMVRTVGRARAEAFYRDKGHDFAEDGTMLFPEDFEERAWREHRRDQGWPVVNRMHQAAEHGRGIMAAPHLAALAQLMEPVPVGSPTFAAWRDEHERRGWPWLPDTGKQPVVFFPKGGPAGLAAFETALRDGGAERREAAE